MIAKTDRCHLYVTGELTGSTFAGTLKRAEPHLFIFLKHKAAEPSNNAAEAALKAAVRQRRWQGAAQDARGHVDIQRTPDMPGGVEAEEYVDRGGLGIIDNFINNIVP